MPAKAVRKGGARSRAKSLKAYREKRRFEVTPEPTGDERSRTVRKKGPIFCVQKHLASHLHYDFRLEHAGVLLSWAVPKGPSLDPSVKRLAMMVEDHPLDYADFEGVIPEGYGAGIVMLWDTGTWKPSPGFEDVDRAMKKGELKLELDGSKLKGSWVLVRTGRGAERETSRSWLLIKHRDSGAAARDVTVTAPLSVKSQGDFVDILLADEPDLWRSNRPARGGESGRMLLEILEEAVRRKEKGSRSAARRGGKRTAKKPTKKRKKAAT
ncbi:MAG TPA: DNA polymerase ligase N-terminal domain-containing protein [Planctomycetota bacterium]|nr:DNA polymerase ligase N-terminal domain-containing protein [Planctomycetota bacterium]